MPKDKQQEINGIESKRETGKLKFTPSITMASIVVSPFSSGLPPGPTIHKELWMNINASNPYRSVISLQNF